MLSMRSPRSLNDLYPDRGSRLDMYRMPESRQFPDRFSEFRSPRTPRSPSFGGEPHFSPSLPSVLERCYSSENLFPRFHTGSFGRKTESGSHLTSGSEYYLMPQEVPKELPSFHPLAKRLSGGEDGGFIPRRYPSDVRVMNSIDDSSFVGPVVTTFGTICLYLEKRIRVDLTLDNSVRVVNATANCKAAIDGRGDSSCLVHPFGTVHQCGTKVEVQTSSHRSAKMSIRGITFRTRDSPVVYLLDEGGVKTTVDNFSDLLGDDQSLSVFYGGDDRPAAQVGRPEHAAAGLDILRHAAGGYRGKTEQVWVISGVRIAQNHLTGDVTVTRDQGRRVIKTSPSRGTISVTTPFLYGCASLPPEAHLFCRRGERRIHGSDTFFSVRNGSQSSGFDEQGRLRIL